MPATLGKYHLVRKLAVGGMAEVYLAKAAGPGGFEKTLVLKRVLSHLAEDENFVAMFRSEAKLAAQLNHPNVVSIFDFGEESGTWYIVMEYIDGPNLRMLFRRALELGQPLPFNLAAKIISAACEGLAYAHEFIDPDTGEPMQLVHRDISPDNILLGRNGGVKVVDFGIAKAANQTHHTKTGTVKGKFSYMAPEHLRGLPLDRRADVFALGMVFYELIAGGKPFDTASDASIMQAILYEQFKPASDRRKDTPAELQRILDRALEKDREARYQDCREFQIDLDQFIVSQGAPVGQHQLAQLVARLATPSIVALATPSPSPSQPNLPRAPAASPGPPPPPPPPPTKSVLIADLNFDTTMPQAHTPSPAPAPVSLGTPRPKPPPVAPPTVEPELSQSFASLEGRADPLPVARSPKSPLLVGGAVGAAALICTGLWWGLQHRPVEPPIALAPGPAAVESPTVKASPPVPVDAPSPPPAATPPIAHADPVPIPAAPAVATPPTVAVAPPPIAHADPVPTPAAPAVAAQPIANVAPRPIARQHTPKAPVIAVVEPAPPSPRPEPLVVKLTEPAKPETGLVDFRVRPYASVFVNGIFYGVTPFAKVKLSVGVHSVKLLNKDLGKEITLSYEVKPGENTLKYNLEAAE